MNTHTIRTANQERIVLTVYTSTTNTTLLIASATGVKQNFYQSFAQYIAANGINVVTFDYHGIGQSLREPINEISTNATEWGSDNLESVIQFAAQTYGGQNLLLLGHSIGGQLIGLAPSSILASKIILVGAQSGYWKFWEGADRIKFWCLWNILFPTLIRAVGYIPSRKFSKMENLPKHVADQWRQWCLSKNYLFDTVAIEKLQFNRIKANIISFSIHDDNFAPKAAVDWLAAAYKNAVIERRHINPKDLGVKQIGHFGFFNKRMQNHLWQPLLRDLQTNNISEKG